MEDLRTNSAGTKDWLKATENVRIVVYEPVFALPVPSDSAEEAAPGDAVQLPEDVAKKMFSKTQPGLPVIGHDI
jgi:hypothetical protein